MRDEKHLKHFLALIHDFIEGDKSRIRYFLEYMNQEDSVDPTLPLANLLTVKAPFVQFMAALLIGKLPKVYSTILCTQTQLALLNYD